MSTYGQFCPDGQCDMERCFDERFEIMLVVGNCCWAAPHFNDLPAPQRVTADVAGNCSLTNGWGILLEAGVIERSEIDGRCNLFADPLWSGAQQVW